MPRGDKKIVLSGLKRNISLRKYSTFKIGGRASYFFEAKNKKNLIKALTWAKDSCLPVFILGGGSNILFSDKGFNGLVIKINISGIKKEKNIVCAGAGVYLNKMVKFAKENNLSGLEWAAGIPGTIGGAVFGNAQAFNKRISDIVKSVEIVDLNSLEIKKISKNKCGFKTKSSFFKKKKNSVIIGVCLKLKKGKKEEIQKKIREHQDYRKKKHPLEFPSAGSVFINPEIKIKSKKILKEFPEIKEFNKKGFVHAGFLIEKCGLKGKKIGGAKISEKHGNFIVNYNNAKAKDVLDLIKIIKEKVKRKFQISLKEEIQIVGETGLESNLI